MPFHVEKEIVYGPKFVEHVYNRAPENWSGIWKKIGHGTKGSPTTFQYYCASCQQNINSRTQLGENNNLSLYLSLISSRFLINFSKSFQWFCN